MKNIMAFACAALLLASLVAARAANTETAGLKAAVVAQGVGGSRALAAEALHLDGTRGWLADSSKLLELDEAVTLEAWVWPAMVDKGGNRIVEKAGAYTLDTAPGIALRMSVAAGSISCAGKLPTNRWSHVAGVFSREEKFFNLYVDGKETASQGRDAMRKLSASSSPVKVGSDSSGRNCFCGEVARVTIYNRALTVAEIAALAADTTHKSHSLPGTVANWFFSRKDASECFSDAPGKVRLRDRPDTARLVGEAPPPENLVSILWYRQPARAWSEALPLGNGRLGAMVFGGVAEERIQLNEDTLWSGEPHDYNHPGAFAHLAEVRKLIAEQKFDDAKKLADATMRGLPEGQASYQPLGDLNFVFENHATAQDYRRELNLADSLARVSYRIGDATFTRELFISNPDQVMVVRLSCDQPQRLSFALNFASQHSNQVVATADGRLAMSGEVQIGHFDGEKHGTRFAAEVRVAADGGKIVAENNTLSVREANAVTLTYSAATSYRNYKDISGDAQALCRKHLDAAAVKTLAQLRAAHVADVRALFNRMSLDLGGADAAQRPTDERVAAVRQGANDPLLVAQSFQFGRYLLMAGSRPGAQPLNLQGIWNETTKPAWGAKWTLNCNAEINYWPVETCNLSECHEPLLRMIEELREPGRVTAKNNYNCRGWVVHHNTDIWHGTAVVDGFAFGAFTGSGAWLCHHLWEHYAFSRDKKFLARAYPTMKEAAEFYVDFLIPDASGHLLTSPSISFEQSFRTPDGKKGALCAGPTIDMQLLRDLFTHCIAASELLGVDAGFRAKLAEVRARLRPTVVSPRNGQIQEWPEDWEPTFGGNQLAPLWGLNPGDEITPWATPALAAAAKKTLLERDMWFGSWASALRVNCAARLGDGALAEQMLGHHMRGHVAPSLLSLFSNRWGFQIDGNLGVTAGIAEMLLQSHGGIISLLPALPPSWSTGKVTGLRARGNYIVDIAWHDGQVTSYRIASVEPREVKVRVNGAVQTVMAEIL